MAVGHSSSFAGVHAPPCVVEVARPSCPGASALRRMPLGRRPGRGVWHGSLFRPWLCVSWGHMPKRHTTSRLPPAWFRKVLGLDVGALLEVRIEIQLMPQVRIDVQLVPQPSSRVSRRGPSQAARVGPSLRTPLFRPTHKAGPRMADARSTGCDCTPMFIDIGTLSAKIFSPGADLQREPVQPA